MVMMIWDDYVLLCTQCLETLCMHVFLYAHVSAHTCFYMHMCYCTFLCNFLPVLALLHHTAHTMTTTHDDHHTHDTGVVLGRGVDNTAQHPLHHAIMVAIDTVADWTRQWYREEIEMDTCTTHADTRHDNDVLNERDNDVHNEHDNDVHNEHDNDVHNERDNDVHNEQRTAVGIPSADTRQAGTVATKCDGYVVFVHVMCMCSL